MQRQYRRGDQILHVSLCISDARKWAGPGAGRLDQTVCPDLHQFGGVASRMHVFHGLSGLFAADSLTNRLQNQKDFIAGLGQICAGGASWL